jgi:hypothetical protein
MGRSIIVGEAADFGARSEAINCLVPEDSHGWVVDRDFLAEEFIDK